MAYRPRKRMLSPSIWGSVDFGTILVRTEEAAAGLFFIGLISLSDDHGVIRWNPERLGQEILRGLYINFKNEIDNWVDEFQSLRMIEKFTYENNNEKEYLVLVSWFDYQKVPHPKLSEQPLPPYKLVDKYPNYKDGLSNSIQTFLRENQKSTIKCLNFTQEYAEYLNIESNILGEMFDSLTQRKGKKTKQDEIKSIMSDSEPSNGEMDTNHFEQFWESYPRKIKKKDAEKAFKSLNPNDELFEEILKDIEVKKKTPQWKDSMRKDNGQYIPLPGSYIRDERWNDERVKVPPRMGESWTN